jgi:hypothetical protein
MIRINLLKNKLPPIESQTQLIYDAKMNTLYVGRYDAFSQRWNLYSETDEVYINAKTRPNIVFGEGQLFLIGPL